VAQHPLLFDEGDHLPWPVLRLVNTNRRSPRIFFASRALIETAIGASIFCIALLALRPPRRLPVATAALAGLFAVFHGQAHGAESADGTARLSCAAGLLLASADVIVAGMWLAHAPAWNGLRLQRRQA
jgi:hydrogenase/urease accessory protein HupE